MGSDKAIKAQNLEQALALLTEDKARVIAGGTDLVIQMREGRVSPSLLVDISGLKELQFISENGDEIEVGAGTVFSQLAQSELLARYAPGLKTAAGGVGSPQIRNRGTIGGNICNGSTAADTVPALLALGAKAVFQSRNGTRDVELTDVYLPQGGVDIRPGEILTKVRFPKLKVHQGHSFYKLGLRKALAISLISISVFLDIDDGGRCISCRVASGALGRCPLRETVIEEVLRNRILDEATIEEAAARFSEELKERLIGRPEVELSYKPLAVKGVFRNAVNQALDVIKKGRAM